ncbi:LTA synthase family protein [Salipaludibacillus sp. CF4.18]|uniref:LTA synthase family protein n=1 Tax=Salipaludibacillus sp. CF4.18 TaxID=3373081 RepID=UPI003EE4EB7A
MGEIKVKDIYKGQQIFILVFLLLWGKTILVSITEFQTSIQNLNQWMILVLNPWCFLIVFLCLISMRNPIKQHFYLLLFMATVSCILYANILYYRVFTDFITIPLFMLGGNLSKLGSSIFSIIHWYDIVYFSDLILIIFLLQKGKTTFTDNWKKFKFTELSPLFTVVLIVLIVNLGLANIERPQLLSRSFDRELLVKNVGIYNYHLYDAYLHTNARAHRVLASEEEFSRINDSIGEKNDLSQLDSYGIAKGKNVILIAAESLQNFVINNTVNGEEITPFLNELISDSIYFEEFYHQTAQGKSSDAEFLMNNSLFPLSRGAVFFSHASNKYHALPEIMNNHGYFTSSLHGNNGSFWNRNLMYRQLGYNRFYTQDDYRIDRENSVGWGLKDIKFMEQSVGHLSHMPQPFYANLITLTNHYPFDLDEEDMYIGRYNSKSNTLNKYFPTVRYMDESLKVLFENLKEKDLYENSMIIIYGDHNGISANHNRDMSTYLEKEITPFVETELQQVPLIIHIPGMEGKVISTVSGQIDFRPTLLHLLGIDEEKQTILGNNLFSREREDLVILRDGSFITDDVVYTNEHCYSKKTGIQTDNSLCLPYKENVKKQLNYSDRIIYGDLLRFDKNLHEN